MSKEIDDIIEKVVKEADSNPEFLSSLKEILSVSDVPEAPAEQEIAASEGDVEALAALASAFYESGEADLVKSAEQIDDVLMQISNPKYAIAKLKLVYDSDLEKLREDGRAEQIDLKYKDPKKHLDEMYGNKAIAAAVESKVDRYRPLAHPLSTRYSPDHPGTQLMRITDRVYQDPITGKIYNYANGYTTDKGTEVPGGGVDEQIPDINTHQSRSMFTTREGIFSENK